MKDYSLEITHHKAFYIIHLRGSDNERNTLKEEIIAQLNQTNKTSEPTSHMPSFSTPLIEGKLSPKESVNSFQRDTPREIPFYAKDIPILKKGQNSLVKENTRILDL